MIDLMRDARPDERFFLGPKPVVRSVRSFGLIRRVSWGPHRFVSWTVGWLFGQHWESRKVWQWYHGQAKCDGSRTVMLWTGQLGDRSDAYVWTRTPKELSAFRWHTVHREPTWDNMGGA